MRVSRLARLGAGIALAASTIVVGSAGASTPSDGAVGPTAPRVDWDGPHETFSDNRRTNCDGTVGKCDEFRLTVDVPASYWDSHSGGVRIEISWPDVTDQFEIVVDNEAGERVAEDGAHPSEVVSSRSVVIPQATGTYVVIAKYHLVVDSGYHGVATFESIASEGKKGDGAFFTSSPLSFSPATIVSPHFLGSEPMVEMETPLPTTPTGALDPDRIFVDWPLDFSTQIGQLHRSTDGGASFRLLFDPSCPTRSRPTCQTAGGGDSDTEVSPYDGTVYFADQQALVAQEAIASSVDHGDSFPAERQFAVTNSSSAADRQWLAAADPTVASIGPRRIHAFLSYALTLEGMFVQGIDESGAPIAQPVPQISRAGGGVVARSGPLRVDVTGGKAHGWIYQPFSPAGGVHVATVHSSLYQDPTAWRTSKITDDEPVIFPWLALDSKGNAYATWVEQGVVYFSASDLNDPVNDPTQGGIPGTKWTPQLRVSLPAVGSTMFPEVVAGDTGRIAIAYDGSDDFEGPSTVAPPEAEWHTYAAVITDALGSNGPPTISTGRVSHRPIHTGSIDCVGGTNDCPGAGDGAFRDMIDVGLDADGRVGVVFTDNRSEFANFSETNVLGLTSTGKPFTHFAKQVEGPSLFAVKSPVAKEVSLNGAVDGRGDATWPNVAEASNLPALDVTEASLDLEGDELVARVGLSEAAVEAMARDLGAYNDEAPVAQPARRLQYVLRFSSATDIFHMSMESLDNGDRRFFGGRLDANDRLDNGSSGAIIGAAYKTDDAYPVSGEVKDGEIVLRAPASVFGLQSDDELFSVTAFAMAGPTEEEETNALNPMRTVDASPPFDAILSSAPAEGLDCVPETTSGPIGAARTITCTARDGVNSPVADAVVAIEATGANDPDAGDSPASADLTCTTNAAGSCAMTHGPGGIGTTIAPGNTTYRAWIQSVGQAPSAGADATEGRDEAAQPGGTEEPDGTDVVEAVALDAPARLILSPEEIERDPEGAATVTATVTDGSDVPVAGAQVAWSMSGVGQIVSSDATTNESGTATATVVSGEPGLQFVTASTSPCSATGDCSSTSTVRWGVEGCDVVGTSGPDLLEGTDAAEKICGLGGDDVIIGNGGDDILIGATGDDSLVGGAGSDTLRGGRGSDGLQGGADGDVMKGGSGSDTIRGGGGADTARGGSGVDQIYGGPGDDECTAGPQKRDEEFGCE